MILFGFGGSVSSMITSLKSNKSLLNGRRSYKDISREYRNIKQKLSADRELNEKEIIEMREELRKKIISDRKHNLLRLIVALSIFLIFIVFVISFFFF